MRACDRQGGRTRNGAGNSISYVGRRANSQPPRLLICLFCSTQAFTATRTKISLRRYAGVRFQNSEDKASSISPGFYHTHHMCRRAGAPIPEVLHNCRPGGLVERAADLSDLRWTVEPEAQSGAVLNRGSNARARPRRREHAADA